MRNDLACGDEKVMKEDLAWRKGEADLLWFEHKGLLLAADFSQTGRNVMSRERPSQQPLLSWSRAA